MQQGEMLVEDIMRVLVGSNWLQKAVARGSSPAATICANTAVRFACLSQSTPERFSLVYRMPNTWLSWTHGRHLKTISVSDRSWCDTTLNTVPPLIMQMIQLQHFCKHVCIFHCAQLFTFQTSLMFLAVTLNRHCAPLSLGTSPELQVP